jgi:hypothetical protein
MLKNLRKSAIIVYMQPMRRGQGRPKGVRFPKKLPVYDTEEGMALLRQLAHHRGVSAAGVVRQLVREEARRIGPSVAPASEPSHQGTATKEEA